jgi:Ca2+-binding EF-hand superfamily protein
VVDNIRKKNTLSEEQMLEIKEAFNVFDSKPFARELKAACTALNIKISKDEIRGLYSEMGKDIKEKINYDEFFEIVSVSGCPIAILRSTFRPFSDTSISIIMLKSR